MIHRVSHKVFADKIFGSQKTASVTHTKNWLLSALDLLCTWFWCSRVCSNIYKRKILLLRGKAYFYTFSVWENVLEMSSSEENEMGNMGEKTNCGAPLLLQLEGRRGHLRREVACEQGGKTCPRAAHLGELLHCTSLEKRPRNNPEIRKNLSQKEARRWLYNRVSYGKAVWPLGWFHPWK